MSASPTSIVMVLDDAGEAVHIPTVPPDPTPILLAAAAVVVLCATMWAALRLREAAFPPEERATRRMCRLLRLTRPERAVLRRLASLPGSPPACALLISGNALRRAADRLRRHDPNARDLAAAQALTLRIAPD